VKKWTDALRSLPAPFDNTGADVYGCLQDASQHFQGVTGEKFLLIASPLVKQYHAASITEHQACQCFSSGDLAHLYDSINLSNQ